MAKKTIFITISRGGTARNILQNDFYAIIKEKFDKVVILSTASDDQRFIGEFKGGNVEIIPLLDIGASAFDRIITRIYSFLNYNQKTVIRSLYNYIGNDRSLLRHIIQYIKYLILKIIFEPFSKITFLRKFLRHVDYLFLQKNTVNKYCKIIEKYKPDIIFCTSIIESTEAALLKAAKKENISTVAFPKTWDNPSKMYFRAKADKIAVWSRFMREQMQKLQDYKEEDIEIVGVPQFDYYIDQSRLISREEFCQKFNLNPRKRILFFGSEGRSIPTDSNIVKVILDFIKNKSLIKDCQILIRPHFAYKNDHLKFKDFFNRKNVAVDLFNNPSSGFRDRWDYSRDHMDNFFNMLYHSDIIINTCSTLTLDAAAINKPVILIKFNGYEKKPLYQSVARWYLSDYYSRILEFKATIETNSAEELKKAINTLLEKPDLLDKQQQRLRDYFCYKIDGQAGQRLVKFIC